MNEFWRRWLIVVAGITAASGVAFAVLGAFGLIGVLNSVPDVLYLPGELAEPAREAALFAIGVMGALMAG